MLYRDTSIYRYVLHITNSLFVVLLVFVIQPLIQRHTYKASFMAHVISVHSVFGSVNEPIQVRGLIFHHISLFQETALVVDFTMLELMYYFGLLYGMNLSYTKKRAEFLKEFLNIPSIHKRCSLMRYMYHMAITWLTGVWCLT